MTSYPSLPRAEPTNEDCNLPERRRCFDLARVEMPDVELTFSHFCQHLDALGYKHTLPKHVSSVFLCAACAHADAPALKLLEQRYFPALRNRLQRNSARQDAIDDVLQAVRERLLVGSHPRIVAYQGRGALGGWLHMVAANLLHDHFRLVQRMQQNATDAIVALREDAVFSSACPEAPVFARRHAGDLQAMLLLAIRDLGGEERQILHLHFAHGLSIDALGRRFGVDRATAARRIRRAEVRIASHVRQQLACQFGHQALDDFEALLPAIPEHVTFDLDDLFGRSPLSPADS